VLLSRGDSNLIIEDSMDLSLNTAVGVNIDPWPREIAAPAVTQLGTLHLMFWTAVDNAAISDALNEIYCEIMYDVVAAPEIRREGQ
jgi:hypothetical protein